MDGNGEDQRRTSHGQPSDPALMQGIGAHTFGLAERAAERVPSQTDLADIFGVFSGFNLKSEETLSTLQNA